MELELQGLLEEVQGAVADLDTGDVEGAELGEVEGYDETGAPRRRIRGRKRMIPKTKVQMGKSRVEERLRALENYIRRTGVKGALKEIQTYGNRGILSATSADIPAAASGNAAGNANVQMTANWAIVTASAGAFQLSVMTIAGNPVLDGQYLVVAGSYLVIPIPPTPISPSTAFSATATNLGAANARFSYQLFEREPKVS